MLRVKKVNIHGWIARFFLCHLFNHFLSNDELRLSFFQLLFIRRSVEAKITKFLR